MAINKTSEDGSINSGDEGTRGSFSESEYSWSENEMEVIRPKPKLIASCNIICISSSEDEDTSYEGVRLIHKQGLERLKNMNKSSNRTSNKIPQRLDTKKQKAPKQSRNDMPKSVPGKAKGQKSKPQLIKQNKKQKKNVNKPNTQNHIESSTLRIKNTSAKNAPRLDSNKFVENKTDAIFLQNKSLGQSTSSVTTHMADAKNYKNKNFAIDPAVLFNVSSMHKHCSVLVSDNTVKNDVIWKDIGGMLSFIDSSRFYSTIIYSEL